MKEFAFFLLVLFWALIIFIVMGIVVLINNIGPKVRLKSTDEGEIEIYTRKGLFYKWELHGSYTDPVLVYSIMKNIEETYERTC